SRSTQPLAAMAPWVVNTRPTSMSPLLRAEVVRGPPASSALNSLKSSIPYTFLRPGRPAGRVLSSGGPPTTSWEALPLRSEILARPYLSAVSLVTAQPSLSSAGLWSRATRPLASSLGARAVLTSSEVIWVAFGSRNASTYPLYSGSRWMSPFSRAGKTTSLAPRFSLVSTLTPAFLSTAAYISARMSCSEKLVEPTVTLDCSLGWVPPSSASSPPPQAARSSARQAATAAPPSRILRMDDLPFLGSWDLVVPGLCGLLDLGADGRIRAPLGQPLGDPQGLHAAEHQFGEQRQHRHQDGAADHLGEVALGEPVDQVAAEPAQAHERGQGGGRHHLHRRGADAGHDQRHGHRQLDLPQHLAAAHAHALGGLADLGVDRPDPDVAVGHDRGHGQGGQGDQDRDDAEASRDEHQDDDAERRDGPAQVGQVDGDQGAPAGVADGDPDGQGDGGRDGGGQQRVPEVLEGPHRDPVRPAPLGRVGQPGDHVVDDVHGRPTCRRAGPRG